MDIKQRVRVKLDSNLAEDIRRSRRLAAALALPPPAPDIGTASYYFQFRDGRLELQAARHGDGLPGGLCVDFLSAASLHRFRADRRIGQPLARAAGIKPGQRPSICDLTAGFGADGFVLACLGCRVTLVERSPLIWALLEDGLRRAEAHPEIGPIIRERITVHQGDGSGYLSTCDHRFDTIFLDPMYPHRRKTALNKLKMRLLRELVGDDSDAADLLAAARRHAARRVAVKRPGTAPFLGNETPSYSVKTRNSRYDIYLTPHL